MAGTNGFSESTLDPAQAAELASLVDLEARWENLRTPASRPPDSQPSIKLLQDKQRAYEGFRAKLAAYNKRFTPTHIPELLLNTPIRLGRWCQTMRDLHARLEPGTSAPFPVHLLEKAYRWADHVAARL